PERTMCDAPPNTTVKLTVFELVEPGPLNVAVACTLTVPTRFPVSVFEATPPDAVALPVPVTEPVPPVWAKLTLAELSGPDVTVFPAASSTVAENDRVTPDARFEVAPAST